MTLRAIEKDKVARIPIFYKNRQGIEQLFNSKHLNQLVYLLKIKYENLKTDFDDEGKMIFKMIENRKIGVFLSYMGVNEVVNEETGEIGYYNEYQLRGFYNTKTGKTTQEIVEKIETAETYEIWKNNFINENKVREKRESERGPAVIGQYVRGGDGNNPGMQEDDFPF